MGGAGIPVPGKTDGLPFLLLWRPASPAASYYISTIAGAWALSLGEQQQNSPRKLIFLHSFFLFRSKWFWPSFKTRCETSLLFKDADAKSPDGQLSFSYDGCCECASKGWKWWRRWRRRWRRWWIWKIWRWWRRWILVLGPWTLFAGHCHPNGLSLVVHWMEIHMVPNLLWSRCSFSFSKTRYWC